MSMIDNSSARVGRRQPVPESLRFIQALIAAAWPLVDTPLARCQSSPVTLSRTVSVLSAWIRMALKLRAVTGKTMVDVLKGLTRQQRRALAEEAVRLQNPGISGGQVKMLVRAGVFPKRFSTVQVTQAVRNQLRDALGAAISFTGSATGGFAQQAGQYIVGVARSVEEYQ